MSRSGRIRWSLQWKIKLTIRAASRTCHELAHEAVKLVRVPYSQCKSDSSSRTFSSGERDAILETLEFLHELEVLRYDLAGSRLRCELQGCFKDDEGESAGSAL